MPILVRDISHCNCYCRNVGEELAEEGDHVGAMAAIAQTKIITQVRREGREEERRGKGRGGKGRKREGSRGEAIILKFGVIMLCCTARKISLLCS